MGRPVLYGVVQVSTVFLGQNQEEMETDGHGGRPRRECGVSEERCLVAATLQGGGEPETGDKGLGRADASKRHIT